MVYVRVKVDKDQPIEALEKMEKAVKDLRPVFRKAEKDLSDIYTKHFTSNGSGKWKPLDAQYGAWKSANYPGRATLVQSGNLFRTIKKFSVREINKDNARFGTDAKVAKFHQYGTWSMPKREIIFEPPRFAKKLARDIAEHIEDSV
jgi:phage gpG-like protein